MYSTQFCFNRCDHVIGCQCCCFLASPECTCCLVGGLWVDCHDCQPWVAHCICHPAILHTARNWWKNYRISRLDMIFMSKVYAQVCEYHRSFSHKSYCFNWLYLQRCWSQFWALIQHAAVVMIMWWCYACGCIVAKQPWVQPILLFCWQYKHCVSYFNILCRYDMDRFGVVFRASPVSSATVCTVVVGVYCGCIHYLLSCQAPSSNIVELFHCPWLHPSAKRTWWSWQAR